MSSASAPHEKPEATEALRPLRKAWQTRLRRGSFWLKWWVLVGSAPLIALMARHGTFVARAIAVGCLISLLLGLVLWATLRRRAWSDPAFAVRRVVVPTDAALGERLLRALGLLDTSDARPGESKELSRLHFERLLRRVSFEAVSAQATRRARRLRWAAITCAVVALSLFAFMPLRIVEGVGVLLAKNGVAPFRLAYLEEPSITAELPSYLKGASRPSLLELGVPTLPEGSVVTVRGTPRVEGRKLVITDGVKDVPFVSDGQGGVLAHWTLEGPTELRVAAQLGDVKIFDQVERSIASTEDREPLVLLEGAPGNVELVGMERLDLAFVVSDDYGLEQVDLVFRSGRREERRSLAKLSGEERIYRSGHALLRSDPFLRRMFLPVAVSVEAKDNRPGTPPQWGKSPAIVIHPPPVGRPEAERYEALRKVRDKLVDLLALDQLKAPEPERKAALAALKDAFTSAVGERAGGLSVPQGVQSFVRAQLEALSHAVTGAKSKKAPTSDAILLAVDVLLSQLSSDGTRTVAPRLGDVVEELAVSAHALRGETGRDTGTVRGMLEHARRGAVELSRLGALGRDIGSVAQADLGRVERSLSEGNFEHVEIAALHLAARLRRPNPSFGSAGGGGVESGMPSKGQGAGTGAGAPSQAPNDFDQMAGELEELAADHAQQISELDQLLDQARAAAAEQRNPTDGRERADALRDALTPLPAVGRDPGSAASAAARGRGHGESMADQLEAGDLAQAVENGKASLEALNEAARLHEAGQGWLDADDLDHARETVRHELEAAQRELSLQRDKQRSDLKERLAERAQKEEQLSQRARELADKGREAEARLPGDAMKGLEEAAQSMRDAANELRQGNAEKARELERKAQGALDRARTGKTQDSEDSESEQQSGETGQGQSMAREGEVPGARERDATREFRERLQRGLGKPSGRLGPAVRRYAEALE